MKLCSRAVVALALLVACESDTVPPPVDAGAANADGGTIPSVCQPKTPDTYPGTSFATNAAVELALRGQFTAFLKPMRDAAADLASKPKANDLKTLFEAGSPSLKAITSAYYATRIEQWLSVFEATAGNMWMPAEPPPAGGGKYGSDLFTSDGFDLRQGIEKGMFGASFYNHALTLMKGAVTAATVDRLVATYGAHPTFPMNDNAMMTEFPDIWIAQYAKRRTRKDAATPGYYSQIKTALIGANAAAEGGVPCMSTLASSLKTLREAWEKVLFATVIFYANDAKLKLTKDNPAVADVSGALHGIAEGVSFAHGFRMLPASDRIATDAQIDEILALFGAPAMGGTTVYKFATDTAAQATKLDQVIDKVKGIYAFSTEQVAEFKASY